MYWSAQLLLLSLRDCMRHVEALTRVYRCAQSGNHCTTPPLENVPIGENETIAVEPFRVLGVGLEEADLGHERIASNLLQIHVPGEEDVGDRRHTHRSTCTDESRESAHLIRFPRRGCAPG